MSLRRSNVSDGINIEAGAIAPAPKLLSQADLFPLRTLIEFPGTVPGADVWGKALAEDGNVYIVKGGRGDLKTPSAEWVGTRIAELVGIQAATARVIQMQSGEFLFGSRELGGAASQAETSLLLTASSTIPGLCRVLSEIYALDMFLNNIDRHEQNYLAIRSGDTYSLYAIDFSRSVFWSGPFDAFPTEVQHTRRVGRELRQRHGFDLLAATQVIDRIASLSASTAENAMSEMPNSWLSDEIREKYVVWWTGRGRVDKLQIMREGLGNGALL